MPRGSMGRSCGSSMGLDGSVIVEVGDAVVMTFDEQTSFKKLLASGFQLLDAYNKKATCVVLFVFVWSSSSAIDVA